jgi:CheY-like chemotaxis protein
MEAVGQLTGGLAHDFNNILTGIVGSLDLLQTRIGQGRVTEATRYIKSAMTSAHRAAALTHRLLAFARRQPLDPKPLDVNRLIGSIEELLRRSIGERIAIELVAAGGLWPTFCDPNQLENVLLNLAINARDAMPDGGRLIIETSNSHLDDAYAGRIRDITPGQYICLSVTDTGTGMPPEVIARAFDPFFTTKPIGQGTGLGLSMVYGFAKQSNGHARIYSEVGQGTTIKLYLPRYRGQLEDDVVADDAEQRPGGAGETVLVIEDDPVVRELVVEILQETGYRALQAGDGPAGLKILNSGQRVDLLVTDVGLPGMNGRQVADAGRLERPDLKVLFITGYAENAALASGFLEPGMAMITKPFAVDLLIERVREMITGERP